MHGVGQPTESSVTLRLPNAHYDGVLWCATYEPKRLVPVYR